jgi:oxygen-dependent protoporphyrinogen oxidase
VRRRLGPTYLDYAVDPFISGIYAGDPDRLIARHALPKLYRLEQEHGSFIRGAIKKQFSGKDEREKKATRKVFSVKGGLQRLTDAMTTIIGNDNILLSCHKTMVRPSGDQFDVEVEIASSGEKIQIRTESIVSTVGSHALPGLLDFISADQLKSVTNLCYAKVVQVAAGFKKWNGIPIPAFGGLIPSREKRKALGILFPSSIFDKRAPKGGALLSIFMGGIKNPDVVEMEDRELENLAISEIRETLKTGETTPDLIRIFRYEYANPQYEITTEERLAAIGRIQKSYPGLILAGNIRDGIGMADRVKQAKHVAEKIIR